MGSINGPKLPRVFEVQQMSHDLTTEGCPESNFRNSGIFKKVCWEKVIHYNKIYSKLRKFMILIN